MARHTALSGGFAIWNTASNGSLKDLATKPSLNGFETRRQDITHIVHPPGCGIRQETLYQFALAHDRPGLINTLFCLVHKLLEAIEDPRFASIRIPIEILGRDIGPRPAFDKFAHFSIREPRGALFYSRTWS
ncbi:hypothetical protein BS47DRAFT_1352299 [Hydnum rufescens UP504]|uniref:Uncharacterized protein n=1 Tax=Hydnum rufescens UP504 TaxID=1448309 RepID=A0A9P6DQ37_9AGAM|nr:hypothetical protein BS47DRAFT_1352299 [Hydnum rufescens UP504]